MHGKRIEFGDRARLELLRGADLLAALVEPTLGPSARRVLIGRAHARPVITDSGYAAALELELPNSVEQIGVQALREVAWRTVDVIGDGTASAILLARATLHGSVRASLMGLSPIALEAGCRRALEGVIAALAAGARPVEPGPAFERLATVAAGGDAGIGCLVAEAVSRVGTEGVALVEEAHGTGDAVEFREGMHLDQGYISAHFATDAAGTAAEFDDPYLLIVAERITELGAVVPALNAFANSGKPLVIIAEDVAGEALATLVANKLRAGFKVAAAKAPGVGAWRKEMLEDIAIVTGGRPVMDELGNRLEDLRPEMLGRAKRIRITQGSTILIGGHGRPEDVAVRCRQLRLAIAREKHLSLDRERLQQRLARLVSGVAVLRFGGPTASAMAARKEQASAAVRAVQAALRHGVVLGGGTALLQARRVIERLEPGDLGERAAFSIVRDALTAPVRAIARNRGRDPAATVAAMVDAADNVTGYDAVADQLTDMAAAGILDPLPVVETALRNAVSTGCRLASVAAAVTRA